MLALLTLPVVCPLHAGEAEELPDIKVTKLNLPRAIALEIRRELDDAFAVDIATRARVWSLLVQTRRDLYKAIASTPPDAFNLQFSKALVSDIDRMMDQLTFGLNDTTRQGANDIFAQATKGVDAVAQGLVGEKVLLPALTDDLVVAAANFWEGRYAGIVSTAKAEINSAISAGVLAGKSPTAVARQIVPSLTSPSTFRSLAARAEAIARTEVMTVHSMAANERIKQIAKKVPKMRKRWISVLDPNRTRKTHEQAHWDHAEGGFYGPPKADEPYRIGPRGKPYLAQYPRDPALPAGERINCLCTTIPYLLDKDRPK